MVSHPTVPTVTSGYHDPALRFFPFAADRLVLQLNPAPGDKVLDCATGTGHAAIAAAQAVGPGGRVIGIDIAEDMLARAQQQVVKMGLNNVDLHVMHAQRLDFRAQYFNHVMCAFGLAFLPDRKAALKEWVRVTRPGGRILFTSVAAQAFQPLLGLLRDDFARAGVHVDWNAALAQPDLAEPERCARLLEDAGLRDVRVHSEQLGYHLRNAEEWWVVACNAVLPALTHDPRADALDTLRSLHLPRVAALASDKGIWLNVETLFSVGTR